MTLILAVIPVLLLIILMAFFKMSGDKSSIISSDCDDADCSFRLRFLGRQSVLLLFIWSIKSCLSYLNHYFDGYFQL